jgi:hypothetical protein
MSRARVLAAPLAVALLTGVGCRLSTDNEIRRERQTAVIEYYGDPIVIHVPETVAVGSEFEVTVRTYGGGCIDEGDTEVSVVGRSASVRPYDHFVTHLPPNYACTSDLKLYMHRALLRFDERGVATVAVHGRVRPGDSAIVVLRSVNVQ